MGKINDLPKLERPREKALHYGIEKLSDYELLAILIASGCKDSSAIDIAFAMLRNSNGLANLVTKQFSDLVHIKGMGKIKAIKIEAAFEIARRFQSLKQVEGEEALDSDMVFQMFRPRLLNIFNVNYENLYLIILNKQKRIIHEINLYKGNENYVMRQIIQQVLLHNGHFFYIVHNHPSGELKPSEDDVIFTLAIVNECKKMNIKMIDHLIIAEKGYYSFLSSRVMLDN